MAIPVSPILLKGRLNIKWGFMFCFVMFCFLSEVRIFVLSQQSMDFFFDNLTFTHFFCFVFCFCMLFNEFRVSGSDHKVTQCSLKLIIYFVLMCLPVNVSVDQSTQA